MEKMENLKCLNHYCSKVPNSILLVIDAKKLKADGINLSPEECQALGSLYYGGLVGELPFMINGKVKYLKVHPFVEALGECIAGIITGDAIHKVACAVYGINPEENLASNCKLFEKFGVDSSEFISAVKFNMEANGKWC